MKHGVVEGGGGRWVLVGGSGWQSGAVSDGGCWWAAANDGGRGWWVLVGAGGCWSGAVSDRGLWWVLVGDGGLRSVLVSNNGLMVDFLDG